MSEYIIRQAVESDIPFLVKTVIAAEKSNSDKLGLATLFNISEAHAETLISAMFNEEVDGCEFSVNSFMIVDYNREPVAALGGWIEAYQGEMPSKILKSNLIGYVFGHEHLQFLREKSPIIKEILIEREPGTLQLEYLFVSDAHRGKKLAAKLIDSLTMRALEINPALEKVQLQVFANNETALRTYENSGFYILKKFRSRDESILNFLACDEKYVMEKLLKIR